MRCFFPSPSPLPSPTYRSSSVNILLWLYSQFNINFRIFFKRYKPKYNHTQWLRSQNYCVQTSGRMNAWFRYRKKRKLMIDFISVSFTFLFSVFFLVGWNSCSDAVVGQRNAVRIFYFGLIAESNGVRSGPLLYFRFLFLFLSKHIDFIKATFIFWILLCFLCVGRLLCNCVSCMYDFCCPYFFLLLIHSKSYTPNMLYMCCFGEWLKSFYFGYLTHLFIILLFIVVFHFFCLFWYH